jgi:serine O-acetyltransferase
MFERIREDYAVHGRLLRERALWAMAVYRFGQWADRLRPAPLRWLFGKSYGVLIVFAPIVTGVYLDRRVRVGRGFHIVHAGGISFHPDVTFGERCGVMQNVTIGMNMRGGVPTIGDDVFIGAGAVILGEITIGAGARIAANSLVINDVPPGAVAMGVPAKIYPNIARLETLKRKTQESEVRHGRQSLPH